MYAIGIGVLMLAAALLSGCSSSSADTAKVISNTSSTSPSSASSTAAKSIYNVGQTVKVSDSEMTVTKVERSNGSDYDKPQKDGDEFVIVTVSIKNDGKDKLSYNPFYFKVQNSQGQITGSAITSTNQSTALNSGDLAPGGSISGTIVFEEPKGDAGLVLQYQDNVFANGTKLQFKLS